MDQREREFHHLLYQQQHNFAWNYETLIGEDKIKKILDLFEYAGFESHFREGHYVFTARNILLDLCEMDSFRTDLVYARITFDREPGIMRLKVSFEDLDALTYSGLRACVAWHRMLLYMHKTSLEKALYAKKNTEAELRSLEKAISEIQRKLNDFP